MKFMAVLSLLFSVTSFSQSMVLKNFPGEKDATILVDEHKDNLLLVKIKTPDFDDNRVYVVEKNPRGAGNFTLSPASTMGFNIHSTKALKLLDNKGKEVYEFYKAESNEGIKLYIESTKKSDLLKEFQNQEFNQSFSESDFSKKVNESCGGNLQVSGKHHHRLASLAWGISELCKDGDYKEELKKYTALNLLESAATPSAKKADYKITLSIPKQEFNSGLYLKNWLLENL